MLLCPSGKRRTVSIGHGRPRRGRGEDSIYFDQANDHWVGAVSLGYKAGKRVRKTVTGRTKTAVKAKLRQLRQELDNGVRSSATWRTGCQHALSRSCRLTHSANQPKQRVVAGPPAWLSLPRARYSKLSTAPAQSCIPGPISVIW
jgi:hypothetical protein